MKNSYPFLSWLERHGRPPNPKHQQGHYREKDQHHTSTLQSLPAKRAAQTNCRASIHHKPKQGSSNPPQQPKLLLLPLPPVPYAGSPVSTVTPLSLSHPRSSTLINQSPEVINPKLLLLPPVTRNPQDQQVDSALSS